MEVRFILQYHEKVITEDIPKLPKREKKRIQRAMEEKLTTQPEFFGKPLRRSLRGYRRLRVGNYRVIFRIQDTAVMVFRIDHRSTVYHHPHRFL